MRRHLTVAALTSIAVLVSAGASARLTRTTGQHPSPAPMTTATSSTIPAELAARDTIPTAPEPAAPAGQRSPLESDEIVLVDDSRPAPDRNQRSAGEYRRLRTEIRRPSDAHGRAPLIVFAHGYDTEPETYEPLIDAWASAGYVVAAPELPGSARDLPGTPQRDIADQARDLSFAAAALLDRYPALIDPARIVAAGHSDGGSAVATIALNSAYTNNIFTAYLVLSGAIPNQVADGTWGPGQPDRTLLITVGDDDENDNLPAAHALYDSTTLPATLVVVAGGDHRHMYLDESTTAATVRTLTIQLLDTVCKQSRSSAPPPTAQTDGDVTVETRQ